MPKSKNRKNHKQKLEQRRKRINDTTNMKKKAVKDWIQQMQIELAKNNQNVNVIDASSPEALLNAIPAVEEVQEVQPVEVPVDKGVSGAL